MQLGWLRSQVLTMAAAAGAASATGAAGATLQQFLQRGAAAARAARWPDKVHVVMGNEAADADSIVSSLCLAYQKDCAPPSAARATLLHLPVMSIPRADLPLRQETTLLLRKAGVDPASIVFSDEVDLTALHARGALALTLTDHNAPSAATAHLADAVTDIFDHHSDMGALPHVTGAARDIAFADGSPLVGSACTLVTERFLAAAPSALTPDIALLLLGVIAVDTVNCDARAARATPRDIVALAELQRRVENVSRDALFKELSAAKFDPGFWSTLGAADALRYDHKRFTASSGGDGASNGGTYTLGLSAVLTPLDEFLAKDGAVDALQDVLKHGAGGSGGGAGGVDALGILSFVVDPAPRRELLLLDARSNGALVKELVKGLQEAAPQLQLRQKEAGGGAAAAAVGALGGDRVVLFEQGNVAASRKQVAPALLELLSKM